MAVGELTGMINHRRHLLPVLGSLETMKGKLLELTCSLQTSGLQSLWMAGLQMHPSPVLRQVHKAAQMDHEAITSCNHLSCLGLDDHAGDTYLSGTLSLPSVDAVTERWVPARPLRRLPLQHRACHFSLCAGGEVRPSCKAV